MCIFFLSVILRLTHKFVLRRQYVCIHSTFNKHLLSAYSMSGILDIGETSENKLDKVYACLENILNQIYWEQCPIQVNITGFQYVSEICIFKINYVLE